MKILIAGDFCPRGRVEEAINKGDYGPILEEVKVITGKADYSLVNFECPVVEKGAMPIRKQGPNLKCSRKELEAVKWAGFDCVTLANNHFLDYGSGGVADTIEACSAIGLDYVGGGKNFSDASQIMYKGIDGQTLAVINCCEHEFSIATEKGAGSNPLDPVAQFYTIKEAKQKADRVLVIIHGGHEHFQLPSLRMVDTYRFFIDAGADAVVNHHQHCFSGFEVYNGKPIFYGLGNFCFDHEKNRSDKWVEGYAVLISFEGEEPTFELYPYRQCGEDAGVHLLAKASFDEKLTQLNATIADRKQLEKSLVDYYEKCKVGVSAVLSPLQGRYLSGAVARGWLPPFISKQRRLRIENQTCCESHRDKLQYFLNKRLK